MFRGTIFDLPVFTCSVTNGIPSQTPPLSVYFSVNILLYFLATVSTCDKLLVDLPVPSRDLQSLHRDSTEALHTPLETLPLPFPVSLHDRTGLRAFTPYDSGSLGGLTYSPVSTYLSLDLSIRSGLSLLGPYSTNRRFDFVELLKDFKVYFTFTAT